MVSANITGSNPQLLELIKQNNCQELKIKWITGLDQVLTFSGGTFQFKEGKVSRLIDMNMEKNS